MENSLNYSNSDSESNYNNNLPNNNIPDNNINNISDSNKKKIIKNNKINKNKKDIINDKQERFCKEYIIDFNAKQAAIRAGYSEKTAENQASRLLSFVKIKKYIDNLKKPIEKKLEITRERIANNFLKYAEINPDGDVIKTSDVLKANEQLSKMFGLYEPEKLNLNHSFSLSELFEKSKANAK
jgi:phage terminase small subunit